MTIQFSTLVRDEMLDAIETAIGVSAKLMIYTGSMPANPAASTTGTKLVEWDLGSDYFSDAASGSKSLSSLPISTTAVASGTAGYFRLFANDGTTCHLQGTVTATGGGGDMTVGSTAITGGQTVNVTAFAIAAGNA